MLENRWFRSGLAGLAFATFLVPMSASAGQLGGYIGGSIGSSAINDNFEGEELDENDTGYKIVLGYQFHPYFAVEADYRDFGEAETGSQAVQNISLESNSWDVFAVAMLPAGPIDLFAKAGVAFWDFNNSAEQAAVNNDGEDFIWGVGGQWNIGNLGIRLEYERIEVSDPNELSMISVGLVWMFGN
jgi:OOP family OmpA-OmpF porin